MGLLAKIFGRVNVVTAAFSDAEGYTLSMAECRRGGESVEVEKARHPVIVVVSGHGVITKRDGEIVERVTAAGSGFVWTRHGDAVAFVRERQLGPLMEAVARTKAKVAAVVVADGQRTAEIVERHYAEHVSLRGMLTPSMAGSAMARVAAARLKLPVLGVILVALAVNMTIAPGVRTRHDMAVAELQAIRRTAGQAGEAGRRRQELLAEYDHAPARPVSVVCDRVAAAVPEYVALTSLAIQPPLHALDNGRKTAFAVNRVEVAGTAPAADAVSRYVAALSGLGIASRVRLASMEQDRESGMFGFRITLEL